MWDAVEIVTLTQAKEHAGITHTDRDDDLSLKLRDAHWLVLNRISRPDETWTAEMLAWTPDTAPGEVRQAISRQFAELDRFRGGDDQKGTDVNNFDLAPIVVSLLRRYIDPALA